MGVSAYLPIIWAPKSDGLFGPATSDPGLIYLVDSEEEEVITSFTLTELIDEFISATTAPATGLFDERSAGNAVALRNVLLGEAGRIDAHLPPSARKEGKS
jgi:hypothetical protein